MLTNKVLAVDNKKEYQLRTRCALPNVLKGTCSCSTSDSSCYPDVN